jgi:thiol:disulfide interchange protein DsbC
VKSNLSFLVSLAAAFATLFLSADTAFADETAIRKSLMASMPDLKIESVRKLDRVDLYEVVANGRSVFYTDPLGETAIVGKMVDVRTRENLTQQRITELSRVDFSVLPLERAIVTVKGGGTRKLAVFADPDCPYCKQLERELDGVDDVTIYTFLFPLTSLHPDAARKARLIWCAPDRARAWSELMLRGREPDNGGDCASPIAQNLELGEKLSIEGTPGIVFPSGRLVPGVIGRDQIERYLAERALPRG